MARYAMRQGIVWYFCEDSEQWFFMAAHPDYYVVGWVRTSSMHFAAKCISMTWNQKLCLSGRSMKKAYINCKHMHRRSRFMQATGAQLCEEARLL